MQPTINGVTLKQITGMMLRYEKLIAWYNKKYNFKVPEKHKDYYSALSIWDTLKDKRNELKALTTDQP